MSRNKGGVKISFQSTLPRRERQHRLSKHLRNSQGFNPRSREGSDDITLDKCDTREVSIHAPAKGATPLHVLISGYGQVSIHAPAKGATELRSQLFLRLLCFNPRSREGSDSSK